MQKSQVKQCHALISMHAVTPNENVRDVMLQVPDHGDGHTVELTNPNGLQLLTQTHFWRAPDKRFGEPEEILEDVNADCSKWKREIGPESPCTNDFDGRFGKTFIRSAHARAVWTHGGALDETFDNAQLTHG